MSRQGMFLLDIIQQKNSLSTFKVLVKIFDGNVLWIFLLLLFFFVFLGGCPKLLHVPTTKNKYMISGHPLSKVSIYLRSRNRVWTWTFCPKYSLAFITIAEMQD